MSYSRTCSQCTCAATVWNGRPEELICVNSPGHAGQMTRVPAADHAAEACRAFRAKPEPAVRPELPLAMDDRTRLIPLTQGLFALVDAADYEWLSRYRWRTTGGTEGYARTTIEGKNVFMHRLIMHPPADRVVDHVNRNRCDNRRSNLRVCTQAENLRNRRSFRGNSRFKGVHWNPRIGKWVASICLNRKMIHLGYFDDETEAAHAYDRRARELFGPFAYLNFPEATRIVLLTGRIDAHSHVQGELTVRKTEIQVVKSEIRSATPEGSPSRNHETNSNHQILKFKTALSAARAFRLLDDLSFGHCFGIRNSCFEFPRSLPWPTGPPPAVSHDDAEQAVTSLTSSYWCLPSGILSLA